MLHFLKEILHLSLEVFCQATVTNLQILMLVQFFSFYEKVQVEVFQTITRIHVFLQTYIGGLLTKTSVTEVVQL